MICLDNHSIFDADNYSAITLDRCIFQLQHLDFVYSSGTCFYTSSIATLDLGLMDDLPCRFFNQCLLYYSNGGGHCQMPIQVVQKYDFYQVSICSFYALQKITEKAYVFYSSILSRDGVIPFLRKTPEGTWSCFITLEDWLLISNSCDSFKSYCFRLEECLKNFLW